MRATTRNLKPGRECGTFDAACERAARFANRHNGGIGHAERFLERAGWLHATFGREYVAVSDNVLCYLNTGDTYSVTVGEECGTCFVTSWGDWCESMDTQQFNDDPRIFAIDLVEQGLVSADHLLLCALKYMSHDDCRGMLDANELSPRFDEDEDEDFELEDEDDVREAFWDAHPEYEDERDDDKGQNDYNATIRTAFVDWVDGAHRDGRMSDELVNSVTLG